MQIISKQFTNKDLHLNIVTYINIDDKQNIYFKGKDLEYALAWI